MSNAKAPVLGHFGAAISGLGKMTIVFALPLPHIEQYP